MSIPDKAQSSPKSYEIKLTKTKSIVKVVKKQNVHFKLTKKIPILRSNRVSPATIRPEKDKPVRRQSARKARVVSRRTTSGIRSGNGDWYKVIVLAAKKYGVSASDLYRVMMCESNGNQRAYNASGASGLFQFMPSTWRSTPYGSYSIWNGEKQCYAAAWMFSQGRKSEWVCR